MKFLFYASAVLLAIGCSTPSVKEDPSRLPAATSNANYCLALRGNGQNLASHWISTARLVEKLGLPQEAVGGSSGSISLFLLDSLAGNPRLNQLPEPQRRLSQALLLKSMPEYLAAMFNHDELSTFYNLALELQDPKSNISTIFKQLTSQPSPIKPAVLEATFAKYARLLNPAILRGLTGPHFAFYQQQIQSGLKMVGSFNAMDADLFFRTGLFDFKYLALIVGIAGDFYAGNVTSQIAQETTNFIDACRDTTYGKALDVSCKQQFNTIVGHYLGKNKIENFPNIRIFEPIGKNIPSLVPTAVLQGKSLTNVYLPMKEKYDDATGIDVTTFFANKDDVTFGYFGPDELLSRIQSNIYREFADYRSQNFLPLGEFNWMSVISTSPDEPGLDALQPIPYSTEHSRYGLSKANVMSEIKKPFATRWLNYPHRDMYSAGGWADLLPTLVLKASGSACNTVAYITTEGGESTFAQVATIRLVGEDKPANVCQVPFWNLITSADPKMMQANLDGRPTTGVWASAACSVWNQVWNAANAASSHNISLNNSDIVVCTNWNNYNPPADEDKVLADAIDAPIFVTNRAAPEFQQLATSHAVVPPGCRSQGN